MAQERALELQRLFDELIGREPAAREALLPRLTTDKELAAEVASLLTTADRAGDFLGALSTTRSPETGSVIAGRYRVERQLGRGAMGEVYLARDKQLDRLVALKFLPASLERQSDAVARFMTEARAAARLDHPHVATVYDVAGAEQGRLFITMAYYSGQSLRERLAAGDITPSAACRIGSQIAAALSAVHSVGIVHRDVKPANVLFDTQGAVKLADFGVAKLAGHAATTATAPGAMLGTLAYMSPEQALGETLDGRSDLWALGVVLYEMLAGQRPFVGETPGELLHAVLHEDPPPLPRDRGIPDNARSVATALLDRDATRRPASANDVGYALGVAASSPEPLGTVAASRSEIPPSEPSLSDVRAGVLPTVLTTFVGREHELGLSESLLAGARLLTFTGPGGTGKTRLALELASRVRVSYADGVRFVSLAEISHASLVASRVGHAIGIRDLGGTPISARVATALRDRQILLVLDNFEHVLEAADFVANVLAQCQNVKILITSRTPLGLQGEQEIQIPPLTIPASTDVDPSAAEAVRLFIQRARSVQPGFVLNERNLDAVAEVCRRLDGLPLALEMAAGWSKLLSPRALMARLDNGLDLLRSDNRDRPERHRTMRAVVSWSYALLTESEQALFDRLAVFAGGIPLDAAQAISNRLRQRFGEIAASHSTARSTVEIPEALDILASLCHKNLLRQEEQVDGEPRFFMLETIREFGLERLRSAGEEDGARRAHRAYFLALAERAVPHLRGPMQAEWFDRLEREYPNFRSALEHALSATPSAPEDGVDTATDIANTEIVTDGATDAARLAAALHRLWLTRGPLLEGAMYLRRAITLAEHSTTVDPRLHAQLLTGAGVLAVTRSAYADARKDFECALVLQRELGEQADIAAVLNHLGWTMWISGDLAAGERMSEEAKALHKAAGNDMGVALSLNNLAWIAMLRGKYACAEEYFSLGIAGHRARGDRRSVAFALGWIGVLVLRRGDAARACVLQEEALAMLEPVADHGYRHLTIARLAVARHAAGEPGDHAATIAEMSLPGLQADGRLWPLAASLEDLGLIWRDRGELERAQSALGEALALRREMGSRAGAAEAQILLATVLHRQKENGRGRVLLADALRDALDYGTIPTVLDGIDAVAEIVWDDGLCEMATSLRAAAERLREDLDIPFAPRYGADRASSRSASEKVLGHGLFAEARASGMSLSIDEAVTVATRMLESR